MVFCLLISLLQLFAEAQGWYKAYRLPLENKEAGLVAGNYVKIIDQPSAKFLARQDEATDSAADATAEAPPSEAAQPTASSNQSQLDDVLARASRRRQMSTTEVEGEKRLKIKIQELENELKNSEFRHRAELSEIKADSSKLKGQCKRLEEENTLLENKALLLESMGPSGGNGVVESELREELETLKESRKEALAKVSKQWERKMDRAQAEIDELQEQVNHAEERERGLEKKLKKSANKSNRESGAIDPSRLREFEEESQKLREEVTRYKDQIGGYLDMIEDLKDELDEERNGPNSGGSGGADLEALEEVRGQLAARAEREKELLSEVQELEAKEEDRSSQLAELMETNGALLKELENAQHRTQELESVHQDLEAQLDEARLKLAEVGEGEGEKEGASVVELEARCRALQAEKESLSEAVDELRVEQSDSEDRLNVVRKEFEAEREELRSRVTGLEQEAEDANLSIKKLNVALESAEKQGGKKLEGDVVKLRKNIGVLVAENNELYAQCQALDAQLDKMESEVDQKARNQSSLIKAIDQIIKAS